MKRLILVFLVVGVGASLLVGAATTSAAPTPSWFAGVWQTSFGAMKIKQNGASVTAQYGTTNANTLKGTVSGRTLRGTWKEGTSTGKFYFTIATDGASFKGAYGNGAEPPTSGWTGTVVSHATQPAAGAGTTTTTSTKPAGPKPALTPSSFAGVWQTSYGVMKITQTGAAVTGRYGTAQTYTITGTVSGRTVRGTWKEGTSTGKFYFTIATDGTSFKGAYGTGAEPPTHGWTGTKA